MLPDFDSVRAKEKYFRGLEGERKYDALNEIFEESAHIVFLGGAGVSTESGIPDFRSKNGLYKKRVAGLHENEIDKLTKEHQWMSISNQTP